jgi:hypothetical protein
MRNSVLCTAFALPNDSATTHISGTRAFLTIVQSISQPAEHAGWLKAAPVLAFM